MAITGLLRFWHTYKNLSRIRDVVNVFLRHGFGQVIERLNLHRVIPLRKRLKVFARNRREEKHTVAERLRMAFSELGPSFIKLAQVLSTRPDLITIEYADEFKKLQDDVPSFSPDKAREIIELELGLKISEVFSQFDSNPIAAASIAQVHNAVLQTGEEVIVKVQRPDIREMIETDIAILSSIARLMLKYIPESKFFNPIGLVDEFAKTVRKELDFVAEAKNAQRFKNNFKDNTDIHIPFIYKDYLTARVLVMERVRGIRIDDLEGIKALGIDSKQLARKGVNAYFKMIFEDGYFHADPHPGNLFVMDDGKIGLMDFGIVGWLAPDVVDNIAGAFLAILNRNFDKLVDLYIDMGIASEEMDREKLRKDLRYDLVVLMSPLYDAAISEINFPEYLEASTHMMMKHGLTVPSELLLMNRTFLIVDNLGRELDPDFNLIVAAEPYAAKLVKRRLSPQRFIERTEESLAEIGELLVDTPRQINKLLRKTMRDEIRIKIEHIGLDNLIKDIDRSSNRMAFSVVVAALIIGSSMLVQSDLGGTVLGFPLVGGIGFLTAFLLGIWLLISIIRSGRM
ncbi:MAG: AarF/ABC1/UbiB kinase family protein [Nitrospira sp.]|nr:AarF/ABC1/UbiB kinase family protein [bacterium]MBL7048366.1 AarF/ABC1/UbiB kinase family protein [Nitrospira sp.]